MVVFSPNICHLSIQLYSGVLENTNFSAPIGWLIKTVRIKTGDTDKLLLSPLSVILSDQLGTTSIYPSVIDQIMSTFEGERQPGRPTLSAQTPSKTA